MYIRAKYRIKFKGHAKFICQWISKEEVFDEIQFLTEEDSMPTTITQTRAEINVIIATEQPRFRGAWDTYVDSKYINFFPLMQYKMYMIKEIERINEATQNAEFDNEDGLKVGDFVLYPNFSLLPIRGKGIKFMTLDHKIIKCLTSARMDHNGNETKLTDWFKNMPKRGGMDWEAGLSMKANCFEFHFTFTRNVQRVMGGKRKKVSKSATVSESNFDGFYEYVDPHGVGRHIDYEPWDPRMYCAADPGHHNLLCAVSPTGEIHGRGTAYESPKMEKRIVTKKWYNHKSFRNKVNKASKKLQAKSTYAEMIADLSACSLKTMDLDELIRNVQVHNENWEAVTVH
jgi:hypothetical protein